MKNTCKRRKLCCEERFYILYLHYNSLIIYWFIWILNFNFYEYKNAGLVQEIMPKPEHGLCLTHPPPLISPARHHLALVNPRRRPTIESPAAEGRNTGGADESLNLSAHFGFSSYSQASSRKARPPFYLFPNPYKDKRTKIKDPASGRTMDLIRGLIMGGFFFFLR